MLCIFVDDSNVKADPLYSVPIGSGTNNHEICYEIYGETGKYFNLLSDKCVTVNAHYIDSGLIGDSGRPMHYIDQISVITVDNMGNCVTIVVETEHLQGKCIATVNGAELSLDNKKQFEKNGVSVVFSSYHTAISAPNCASSNVLMLMFCKKIEGGVTNKTFVEFEVQAGMAIRPSAHGLVGKYCIMSLRLA